jgi:diamine N-acetyltransferase
MLKIAKKTDISTVQSLAKKIWQEHYVPFIGQAQIDYMLGKFYTNESLLQQIADGQMFYLIDNEDIVSGFVAVSRKEDATYFIHKFYIDGRGKGLGTKVFEDILSLHPDATTFRLTVNKHNYKSINFYFKIGFIIENTAVFDIGNGFVMDDFVMVWQRKA